MKRKTEKEWKSRAEKQAEKERKRQIKEANRMLISTPKKTVASMGFLSFDPAGAFCFEGSRWIKIYRVTGSIAESVKVVLEIKSRLRITERIVPTNGGSAEENYYISLIAQGDMLRAKGMVGNELGTEERDRRFGREDGQTLLRYSFPAPGRKRKQKNWLQVEKKLCILRSKRHLPTMKQSG